MNAMKAIPLFLFFALLAVPADAFAQEFRIGQFQGGLQFLVAAPRGEFRENTDDIGYGLTLDLGYVIPRMPVVVGGTFGFATYGSRTFRVPLSQTVQLVNVELENSNNFALGHLFLRFQPQTGVFRPYFEGLVGMNYFWTESTVEDERYENSEFAGSVNLSDVAFSYGAGGGVMFCVYRGETDDPGRGVEVFIDARVRYLVGGEAEYFDEDSIVFDNQGVPQLYEENAKISETDMLAFGLGVSVRF